MTKGQEPESHHTSRVSEHPLRTILMSLPTSSRRLRLANLAINTMLALFVAEFVLTPFLDPASNVRFSRVGAIYPDRVKITVRYPLLNDTAGEDVVRVVWREAAATERISWKDGPLLNFQEQSDWVDTVSLDGLWPSTSYECGSLVGISLVLILRHTHSQMLSQQAIVPLYRVLDHFAPFQIPDLRREITSASWFRLAWPQISPTSRSNQEPSRDLTFLLDTCLFLCHKAHHQTPPRSKVPS